MIEPLFNHLGVPLTFGLALVFFALPLAVAGGLLRRGARRARTRWELALAAQRPLRDVQPGRVVVTGTLRVLGAQLVIEEDERCAIVERGPDAEPLSIADGARVLVIGYATRQADNPLGGAYRDRGKVWVIEGDGAGEPVLVSGRPRLPVEALRSARLRARVGYALLGAAVAVAVGSAAVCYRASTDDPTSWSDAN